MEFGMGGGGGSFAKLCEQQMLPLIIFLPLSSGPGALRRFWKPS